MASLSLKNVCKVYPNGFEAVKDFNLEIADQEFIIFVGPSGCGKSTTLRMIAGLEDISSGELKIGDRVVNDVEPKDRDIAMVFQNYALYPHMSVYDNMAFGLKLRKVPKDQIDKMVKEAARLVDMAGVNVFHLLQAAFSPIAKVAQTWYGMVILLFIEAFVYSMGISCWVMSPITNPILTMAIVANIEMARNGVTDVALLNLYTQATIYCAYYAFGGIGNTLALNLMSLRSKSNKIKGLSRASIAPSIFNINEPIVFGMIAWNPFLMVPMWLNGIITPLLMWLFTKIIPFAPIPITDFSGFWCMPFPFVTWLGTQSLNAVILMLGLFVVSWLIYYPFYKVYEKQEIENERIALESK